MGTFIYFTSLKVLPQFFWDWIWRIWNKVFCISFFDGHALFLLCWTGQLKACNRRDVFTYIFIYILFWDIVSKSWNRTIYSFEQLEWMHTCAYEITLLKLSKALCNWKKRTVAETVLINYPTYILVESLVLIYEGFN